MSPNSTTKIVLPHSSFLHPEKTWVDIFISFLFTYLLPLGSVCRFIPSPASNDVMACVDKLRQRTEMLESSAVPGHIAIWSKKAECSIAECAFKIPRKKNILREWGIADTEIEVKYPAEKEDGIEVIMRFPSTLIPEGKHSTEKTETGCVKVEAADLSDLPDDIPIIIWFHGGGMILGSNRDSVLLENCVSLTDIIKGRDDESKR
jgi:hypothetical protein